MKTTPTLLPADFVSFLQAYAASAQFKSITRLHRGLILRWSFWADGVSQNAIPGYSTPPPAGPHGYPAGWSPANLRRVIGNAPADSRQLISTHR